MSKSVLRLTLTNATPLLVGWHDPYTQDPLGIRATEIKGLWRWWCRVFIAGAMFDQEMLCGQPDSNVLCIPRVEETEAISCLVGKILGLGYAGKHKAEASRFRLFVEIEGNVNIKKFKNTLQRVKLLSLKQGVEGLDVNSKQKHRFILVVEKTREKYRDAEDLALKILIASLQLSGIGKGSRRGLGSLDITSMNPGLVNIDINDPRGSLKKLIEDIYKSAKDIVKKYGNECNTKVCRSQISEILLPPLPVVSKSTLNGKKIFQVFAIAMQGGRGLPVYTHFVYVHNFFVRSERCKQLKGRAICKDDLRNNLDAWFLGLPREQRGTGYLIESKLVSRRPSPIILAYHSNENIFGQGMFMSIFLSGDWPRKLMWVEGEAPRPIEIDFNRISNAYDTFISEFNSYLSRRGLVSISLWP